MHKTIATIHHEQLNPSFYSSPDCEDERILGRI